MYAIEQEVITCLGSLVWWLWEGPLEDNNAEPLWSLYYLCNYENKDMTF